MICKLETQESQWYNSVRVKGLRSRRSDGQGQKREFCHQWIGLGDATDIGESGSSLTLLC